MSTAVFKCSMWCSFVIAISSRPSDGRLLSLLPELVFLFHMESLDEILNNLKESEEDFYVESQNKFEKISLANLWRKISIENCWSNPGKQARRSPGRNLWWIREGDPEGLSRCFGEIIGRLRDASGRPKWFQQRLKGTIKRVAMAFTVFERVRV